MPAGPRIRGNNSFGVTTDNPLTAGATTFNSAALNTLPVVSSAHAVVVLDPKRVNGEPEIVVVTSHTALATVATITRGAYGTVARSHPFGTAWAHVPVDEDYIEILTSVTRPSDPYNGQMIFETDTNKFVARYLTNTAWQDAIPLGQWDSYTPTLTQGGVAVTKTVNYARYTRIGRIIHVNVFLTVTGTGTINTVVEVGLPFTSALSSNTPIGVFYIADASTAPFNWVASAVPAAANVVRGITDGNAQYLGVAGSVFSAALANTDVVGFHAVYEATT